MCTCPCDQRVQTCTCTHLRVRSLDTIYIYIYKFRMSMQQLCRNFSIFFRGGVFWWQLVPQLPCVLGFLGWKTHQAEYQGGSCVPSLTCSAVSTTAAGARKAFYHFQVPQRPGKRTNWRPATAGQYGWYLTSPRWKPILWCASSGKLHDCGGASSLLPIACRHLHIFLGCGPVLVADVSTLVGLLCLFPVAGQHKSTYHLFHLAKIFLDFLRLS